MSVMIREATEVDRSAWDGILAGRAAGSFYHLFDSQDVIRHELDQRTCYLIATDAGQLAGLLPPRHRCMATIAAVDDAVPGSAAGTRYPLI